MIFFSPLAFSLLSARKSIHCSWGSFPPRPEVPIIAKDSGHLPRAVARRAPGISPRPRSSGIYGARPRRSGSSLRFQVQFQGLARSPGRRARSRQRGPGRQGPLGAPELGGGVREPPEEDGLRTQQAELLQTPQEGKAEKFAFGREGKCGAAPGQGTLGAAGSPPGRRGGARRRTARGRHGGRRGRAAGRAALFLPARG